MDTFALERFELLRLNYGVVYEIDIRRWAMRKASEVNNLVVMHALTDQPYRFLARFLSLSGK